MRTDIPTAMDSISFKKKPTLVWEIGIDKETKADIEELFGVSVYSVPQNPDRIFEMRMSAPEVILTSEGVPQAQRDELVQIIGLKYIHVPIFHVVRDWKKFDLYDAQARGIRDVFLLPYERVYFEETLTQILAIQDTKVKKLYETVRLVDIDPFRPLTFDLNLFMRANRKFICLVKKGTTVGVDRLEKLQSKMSTAYVAEDEMVAFNIFVKESLRAQNLPEDSSATERKKQLRQSITLLLREFFNQSKKFPTTKASLEKRLEHTRTSITKFLNALNFENWYQRILEVCGDRLDQSYTHAVNTAMYAAFLSMATGIGRPEDLALAGILHDLGIAFISDEAQEKDYDELSDHQKSIFRTHVQKSVNEITTRDLSVNPLILKAISQTHEKISGRGYPSQVAGNKLMKESQILMLADQIDELTSFTPKREALTPDAAIKKIHEQEELNGPIARTYDPTIFMGIMDTFLQTAEVYKKKLKAS